MSLDPASPLPATPEARTAVSLADVARRVAILERATKGSTAWKPIPASAFLNGWTPVASAFLRPASYWIDDNGVVRLSGGIQGPAVPPGAGVAVLTLPAEARPPAPWSVYGTLLYPAGPGTSSSYTVAVGTNILITSSAPPANAQLILDGITYRNV